MTVARGGGTHVAAPVLDAITVLASVAAVLVALVAVGVGLHVARGERKHARLVDRQRALIDLLTAFEAMQAFRVPKYGENGELTTTADESPQAFEEVRARWRANLYASAEALPYTRNAAFSHFGAGPFPNGARQEGNPEVDTPEVMTVRGEIMVALDALRDQLEG